MEALENVNIFNCFVLLSNNEFEKAKAEAGLHIRRRGKNAILVTKRTEVVCFRKFFIIVIGRTYTYKLPLPPPCSYQFFITHWLHSRKNFFARTLFALWDSFIFEIFLTKQKIWSNRKLKKNFQVFPNFGLGRAAAAYCFFHAALPKTRRRGQSCNMLRFGAKI